MKGKPRKPVECVCIMCGKRFLAPYFTKLCSAECRKAREYQLGSESYRRARKRLYRLSHAVKHDLKKHDEAIAASGYAPKIEVREGRDAYGRRCHIESRGHIPGGAI